MPSIFKKLNQRNMASLRPGERLREHGIEYESLVGDGQFRINIMVDGRRVHRTVGRVSEGMTRQKAWECVSALRVAATEDRLHLPKGRKTEKRFATIAKEYLKELERTNGKDIAEKRRRLELHLIPFFGSMSLSQIDALSIERYKRERIEQPSMRGGVRRGVDGPCCPIAKPMKKVTPATINRELAVLSHLLNCAVAWTWMPAKSVKIVRFGEPETRFEYLTEADAAQLLTAAASDSHPFIHRFIFIALHTAMRAKEVLSLKRSYIDLEKQVIALPDSKTGAREVPISANLKAYFEHALQSVAEDAFLFPSTSSKLGHCYPLSNPWRRVIKAAGLTGRRITPHTLRHTAISHLVQAGVDLPTVQRVSGHKTFEMVRRYAHQNAEHVQKALSKLDGRLGSGAFSPLPNASASGNYTGITQKKRTRGRKKPQVLDGVGRPCRDRTYDQRIKSPLLYQLS